MHIDEKIVRIAAEGNLVINYSPSHYGQEKYFKFLNNNLVAVSKIEVLASSEKLCGWSMDIWTWSFKKKRVAIFLYQDLIWMFLDGQYFPVLHKNFFRQKFLFWNRAVFMNNNKVVARIEYFTPPLRFLADDGMFPESVEPINDILNDISEKNDYLEKIEFLKKQGSIVTKQNS